MKFFPALFPLVLPCSALAFPLSHKSTSTAKTHIPLIVISISLFFFLVAIKLVYMKHRRIGTIHAPPGISVRPTGGDRSSRASRFGLRDKRTNRHRGLLVGFLGSPTWETNLTSRLDGVTWRHEQRRRSFMYQRHTGSGMCSTRSAPSRIKLKNSSSSSRLTGSTVMTGGSIDADQFGLPSSSGHSWVPGSSRSFRSVQRNTWTHCHPRYGDFGESHGVKSARGSDPKAMRRASPCSIRLVDGPSQSSQVEYSFLSGLPPDAIVLSPLTSTRDSFQLCRCSLKCSRGPVPPLPSLPSFLPFHLPKDSEALESHSPTGSGYLPSLRFSPLVSVGKVFHARQQEKRTSSRTPDPDENKAGSLTSSSVVQDTPALRLSRKTNVKSDHKRSQTYKGLAIERSSPRTTLVGDEVAAVLSLPLDKEPMQTGFLRTPSRNGGVDSKGPLKSCLRQNCVAPLVPLVCSPGLTLTPSTSDTSTQTYTGRSMGDPLWTPISDVDIGILGLDRFHWNDDIQERSLHMKRDSVALVPHWE